MAEIKQTSRDEIDRWWSSAWYNDMHESERLKLMYEYTSVPLKINKNRQKKTPFEKLKKHGVNGIKECKTVQIIENNVAKFADVQFFV